MDRWFENAFKSMGMPALQSPATGGAGLADFYRPQIDISADANRYLINLDVPGLNEADLSLEVASDVLTIKGQKEEKSEDKETQLRGVSTHPGVARRRQWRRNKSQTRQGCINARNPAANHGRARRQAHFDYNLKLSRTGRVAAGFLFFSV